MIPEPLLQAIGPAGKAGRARWIALAERLGQPRARKNRPRDARQRAHFGALGSDARFALLFQALEKTPRKSAPRSRVWTNRAGKKAARIESLAERTVVTIDEKAIPAFGAYLVEQLDDLYAQISAGETRGGRKSKLIDNENAAPRSSARNTDIKPGANTAKEKGPRNEVPEAPSQSWQFENPTSANHSQESCLRFCAVSASNFLCPQRGEEMQPHLSTTPFGRRSLSLAHVASQTTARARPPEKAAHKWQVFRAICAAKARIGVSERALAVLDALLSFHPETVLTGEDIIVFPSNQQLALRAHGMAPATLRRHLAALVDGGLIIRRDSPNGKRYARKGQGGEIALAFGFDLGPLVARAEEFAAMAAEVQAEERALRLVRERITICRRDIAKMIAAGIEENVPLRRLERGPRDWMEVHALYRGIVARIPRTATRLELEPLAEELSLLADEVLILLEDFTKSVKLSGNEFQIEHHKHISNSQSPTEL